MAAQTKERYMYIACDKADGGILLNAEGVPYFRVAGEGEALDWPDEIRKSAVADPTLRVAVESVPQGQMSPTERKEAKRLAKENAKKSLCELAAEPIQQAIDKRKGRGGEAPPSEAEPQSETPEPEPTAPSEPPAAEAETAVEEPRTSGESTESSPEADRAPAEKPAEERPAAPAGDKLSPAGLDLVVTAVVNAERKLNEDILDMTDALQDAVDRAGSKSTAELKQQIRSLEDRVKAHTGDAARSAAQSVQKETEKALSRLNGTAHELKEDQSTLLSRTSAISKRVSEVGESVESMEGALRRLGKLDTIVELLQSKGMTFSMEIPPVSAEEADIVNLVRYSQKIAEQLGYAARELIRKRDAFQSQARNNADEQRILEEKNARIREQGVRDGRKDVVKRLVAKYEDLDAIRTSENGHVHAIWTLLMELGAEIDGDGQFQQGREVTLSGEEAQRMQAAYAKIDGPGAYTVTRTGLVFAGEIICKAEFQRTPDRTEEPAGQEPSGEAGL